jgi:hypothetical protein
VGPDGLETVLQKIPPGCLVAFALTGFHCCRLWRGPESPGHAFSSALPSGRPGTLMAPVKGTSGEGSPSETPLLSSNTGTSHETAV